MSFLLDTNTCIDFLRGRHPAVRDRIRSRPPGTIAVSVVTAADLRHGAERSAMPETTHAVVGAFLGDLEREGRTIGANDLFIAAHVSRHIPVR